MNILLSQFTFHFAGAYGCEKEWLKQDKWIYYVGRDLVYAWVLGLWFGHIFSVSAVDLWEMDAMILTLWGLINRYVLLCRDLNATNEDSRDQIWFYPCSCCYAWWRYCYSIIFCAIFQHFLNHFCVHGCGVFRVLILHWFCVYLWRVEQAELVCNKVPQLTLSCFVVFTSIDIRFLYHTQCTCQLVFLWRTGNIRDTSVLCCVYYYSIPAFNHL